MVPPDTPAYGEGIESLRQIDWIRRTSQAPRLLLRLPLAATMTHLMSPLILLVDDFDDALEMYAAHLTFHGYRVATATSGQEAVMAAVQEPPSLILMDLQMHGMDGTTAMRTLRRHVILDTVPIAAFTAHALPNQCDAAIRDGFDVVITKPCLPDELLTWVRTLVGSPTDELHRRLSA